MTSKPQLVALVLLLALVGVACSTTATTGTETGQAEQPEATIEPESEPAAEEQAGDEPDEVIEEPQEPQEPEEPEEEATEVSAEQLAEYQSWLENLATGWEQATGIWPGFDPNEHPTVLAVRDSSNTVTGAITINHGAPEAMGTATALDVAGLPFESAHYVSDLSELDKVQGIEPFNFGIDLGGVDSFAIMAGGTDQFFDPSTKEFVATLLHEMFHRYQFRAFNETGVQDFEGYAYTAENFELAMLEDRALAQAFAAENDDDFEQAARHFAALRLARLEADSRVAHDESQEIGEGTARWLEHTLARDDEDFTAHANNFGFDLVTDFADTAGLREWYGFGRFYGSGAAAVEIAHRLGIADVTGRIEANESPAAIIADHFGITADDVDGLVEDARTQYDPLNEVPAAAAEAAETAQNEPPIFGDQPTGAVDFEGGGISDEEIACFEERGIDIFAGDPITDEDFNACASGGVGEAITDEQSACLDENGVDLEGIISDEIFDLCFG